MAKTKYKVTGFARFVLFMLFFLPIAYFGLSMAKGDNPDNFIEKIKTKVSQFRNRDFNNSNEVDDNLIKKIELKDEEIQKLREDLFKCQTSK